MSKILKGDVGGVNYTVNCLTDITTCIFVSNYVILYNRETNKLRVFDKTKVNNDLTTGELFNSENNDSKTI